MSSCLRMLQTLNELFLGRPFAGGWIDRFSANLDPAVDHVPASSLYHLYGAYREIERSLAGQPAHTAS